jgi:hypothetical protein
MVVDKVRSAADLPAFATAYDFIFDAIDHDEALVRFLAAKNSDLQTGADIRWYIEEYLLRAMAQAVLDKAIGLNRGLHDSALMAVALCLDDFHSHRYPNSRQMIEWLYYLQDAKDSAESGPCRFFANYLGTLEKLGGPDAR